MLARLAFRKRHEAATALGLAGCFVGGCAVERTTAVELVGRVTGEAGSTVAEASIDAPTADASNDETAGPSSAEDASDAGPVAPSCTMASATCIADNTGCNVGSYYLYDNQWNCGASTGNSCGPESAYGCVSADGTVSWLVTSNQAAGNTAVLSYPAMQDTFGNNPPLSSFTTISSTFAETGPHRGIYEYAYDVWLNGVAAAGSTQILVWVDNYHRVPAGSQVATTTLAGHTYDVWRNADGSSVVLESRAPFTSGTVDLLKIIDWTIAQTWLLPSSTLGQIEFGVEIASTDGASATYAFNAFSIFTN
jgi:hypothetical protein